MMCAMPSERPRLSVAMIVRDEEHLLPAALASVRSIADEIVVADTGSLDGTVRVAQSHGARVIDVPWNDDFAAARNACLDHSTGDWVLWLDAGERLSASCTESLREFVDGRPDTTQAWLLMVQLPPERPDETSERIGRIRLLPRRADLRFSGRVRESLRLAIAGAGMSIEVGPWKIHRTTRDHDPEVKRERALRDLRLIELEIQDRGPGAHLLLAVGEICSTLGDPTKAAEYFRQTIASASRGSTEMLSAYYGLLTTYPADGQPTQAQLEVCIEALESFPYDAQLLCAMGSYLQAQNQFSLAQRSYRAAHEFGQVDPETWHVGDIGEVAAVCLSLNLQLLSDDDVALKVLDEAQQRYPTSVRLARRRLELHVKYGRTEQALTEVDELRLDRASRDLLRSAVRGAAVASQKNWIPALAYLETAYDGGCRDALCLRWYTVALYSTEQSEKASQVLADWSLAEPHCLEIERYRERLCNTQRQVVGSRAESTGSSGRVPAPHILNLPKTAAPHTQV